VKYHFSSLTFLTMDSARGNTYAGLMSVPARSPRGLVASLQSQHAPTPLWSNRPRPTLPAPEITVEHVEDSGLDIVIELVDEPTPAPPGGSYADNMVTGIPISDPDAELSLPTPPPTPAPMDVTPHPVDQDPPFPPLDAKHKSDISSMELPAAASSAEERQPVGEERASVLFSPAEKVCSKRYGGRKGLRGDPVKLERLNGPAKFSLESRWATS
jgi:hypothetical protein